MSSGSRSLYLHVAESFYSRLLGLHAYGGLGPDEGLLIVPCRAVHTFFLTYAIDVVFLDARGHETRSLHQLQRYRIAVDGRARMVVELPAGYCQRCPDYLARIHAALHLRVCPRLLPRAQSGNVRPSA